MTKKIASNFQVIAGKYVVLQTWIQADQIGVRTEICPFCQRRHLHGTGGEHWSKFVETTEGIRTLGHRALHCVPHGIKITLAHCKNRRHQAV